MLVVNLSVCSIVDVIFNQLGPPLFSSTTPLILMMNVLFCLDKIWFSLDHCSPDICWLSDIYSKPVAADNQIELSPKFNQRRIPKKFPNSIKSNNGGVVTLAAGVDATQIFPGLCCLCLYLYFFLYLHLNLCPCMCPHSLLSHMQQQQVLMPAPLRILPTAPVKNHNLWQENTLAAT